MSAEVFNRIAALEALLESLQARVLELEEKAKGVVIPESDFPSRPTLSLKQKNA